jgi:hypothetical protein
MEGRRIRGSAAGGRKVPKDDGTAEQFKYRAKILSDLRRQQHWDVAHPFYEPVGTSIGTIVLRAQNRRMSIHRCG